MAKPQTSRASRQAVLQVRAAQSSERLKGKRCYSFMKTSLAGPGEMTSQFSQCCIYFSPKQFLMKESNDAHVWTVIRAFISEEMSLRKAFGCLLYTIWFHTYNTLRKYWQSHFIETKWRGIVVLPKLYSESMPQSGFALANLLPKPMGWTDQYVKRYLLRVTSSTLVKCELMSFVVTAPMVTIS